MYTATFIFDKKQFDDAFYRLDAIIAEIAKQTEGYIGEEAWESSENGRVCNIYYWKTMEGLQALMQHPKHQEAKAKQANKVGETGEEEPQGIKLFELQPTQRK